MCVVKYHQKVKILMFYMSYCQVRRVTVGLWLELCREGGHSVVLWLMLGCGFSFLFVSSLPLVGGGERPNRFVQQADPPQKVFKVMFELWTPEHYATKAAGSRGTGWAGEP